MNLTTSPFATGEVPDPFAGAQFGFTIPTGDPGQIIQAAQQTMQYRAG